MNRLGKLLKPFLLLNLFILLTLAQKNHDKKEEKKSPFSFGFFKPAVKKVFDEAEEKRRWLEDPEEKDRKEKSTWFDGPPRLNCSPSPGKSATEDRFLDSFLVKCMRAHRYETSQLPIQPLGMRERLNIRYLFEPNNLIDLDKEGKLTIAITLKLVWYLKIFKIETINFYYYF